MQDEKLILKGYEYAKEQYGAIGVNADEAIALVDVIPVSMQCWQGDDVIGFDGLGKPSGGIAATGDYPGRARTPQELRQDIDFARTLFPGETKINLHACYAEKNGKKIDRDTYTVEQFRNWLDWAEANGYGLDFNPTYFSHPMMDGDFSLASAKEKNRRFWVEHGIRCREIGLEFARKLGKPCLVNYWMPDGFKDICVNTAYWRAIMQKSLDEIFAQDIDEELVPCALESKLFGFGLESYTVASHEFALGYAVKNNKVYCLDTGHFHPTEVISAKLSACLAMLDKVLLHVSRGVRWDSDHVILWDDELQHIMDEILFSGFTSRVFIGLDYFDASINRIACWVIGMRNARKALLGASLAPVSAIQTAELSGDNTLRLALMEERKSMPVGAVWDYYCMTKNIPTGCDWITAVKAYETREFAGR